MLQGAGLKKKRWTNQQIQLLKYQQKKPPAAPHPCGYSSAETAKHPVGTRVASVDEQIFVLRMSVQCPNSFSFSAVSAQRHPPYRNCSKADSTLFYFLEMVGHPSPFTGPDLELEGLRRARTFTIEKERRKKKKTHTHGYTPKGKDEMR